MIEKEYISRKDLEELGFIDNNTAFDSLYKDVNEQVCRAVEIELKTEIKSNHTNELLGEYMELLKSNGFSSHKTQHWLESNIPALHQIEIEWREITLGDIYTNTRTNDVF